jgi:lipopolysaccharide transport system permease protein
MPPTFGRTCRSALASLGVVVEAPGAGKHNMLSLTRTLLDHRELIWVLAWKNIVVRYKQAYLGLAWAVLRPVMLMLIFTLVRAFIEIDSGGIPYPILTFAALMPWMLFQDATSEGASSVVQNANLVRKIYFPREVFPLTAVFTKIVEFAISVLILALLMAYFHVTPTIQILWAPLIVAYVILVSLSICFAGAALNVYFRDVSAALPVALSLLMYASPVIYPLSLVKRKLLQEQIAGDWSDLLYTIYTANPLAGIIHSYQRVVLEGLPPDFSAMLPGIVLTALVLPFSYAVFKRAEAYFADIV